MKTRSLAAAAVAGVALWPSRTSASATDRLSPQHAASFGPVRGAPMLRRRLQRVLDIFILILLVSFCGLTLFAFLDVATDLLVIP